MSVVFFRFRAAVDNNTLVFDGHGLKLSELKRKVRRPKRGVRYFFKHTTNHRFSCK